jgi:hypothetical protein
VSIRGQLNAIRHAPGDILKELRRKPRVSPPNHPTDNELGIRFDRREGPHVTADPLSGIAGVTFFCFAPTKDQISSTWTR